MPHSIDNEVVGQNTWDQRRTMLEGVVLGAIYGILLRRAVHFNWSSPSPNTFAVMTATFIFGSPVVIGILTIRRAEAHSPIRVWQWILLPWISVGLMLVTLWLFVIEGTICVVMAAPIALVCASIGGVIGGIWGRLHKPSNRILTCIAVLPLIFAPLEARVTAPPSTRTVASEILIHAPAATIWQNIERVPAIAPSELRSTWTYRIGFPRPIEATLSYEGVGGVRHASFERGLLFIETITAWEPQHRIAFSIKADSAHIPTTTLDEHVTIGGRYFDVLNGEYTLEPLANGDTMLHLVSHQRLSTDFNDYAGLWTDAVMQNIQNNILIVIKHRCEARKL
ncbi:MAG TPA: hypothetical protein VFE38_12105 [Edaphobacter sp.]|nr:hypothetical protein [Edaphobacter sp.]